MRKRVVVATLDPWLDTLHGMSVLSLFESLSELGYSVKVLLPSRRNRAVKRGRLLIVGLGFKRWIPVAKLFYSYIHFFRLTLREGELSALIVDYPLLPLLIITKLVRKAKGIMLVLSRPVGERGILSIIRLLHFRLSLTLARHVVDTVTAISPLEAAEFSKLGKIPREKIVVVPSPISSVFTNYEPTAEKDGLRFRLGMNSLIGKTVILYHGALDQSKGVMEVVIAFAEAFKHKDDIMLLLVGDGSAKESIEKLIKQSAVKNVMLLGVVPYSTMPEIVAACDLGLVILPDHSWWRYQCPTKLIELLAIGKPVIAGDLPGIKWAAGGSLNVVYVNSLRPEEFRKALRKALDITNDAAKRIETDYVTKFSSKSLARKLNQIISEPLNR